jgi:hypothetical protein
LVGEGAKVVETAIDEHVSHHQGGLDIVVDLIKTGGVDDVAVSIVCKD